MPDRYLAPSLLMSTRTALDGINDLENSKWANRFLATAKIESYYEALGGPALGLLDLFIIQIWFVIAVGSRLFLNVLTSVGIIVFRLLGGLSLSSMVCHLNSIFEAAIWWRGHSMRLRLPSIVISPPLCASRVVISTDLRFNSFHGFDYCARFLPIILHELLDGFRVKVLKC